MLRFEGLDLVSRARKIQRFLSLFAVNGHLWLRFSAQVYNELSDYEALARVFG